MAGFGNWMLKVPLLPPPPPPAACTEVPRGKGRPEDNLYDWLTNKYWCSNQRARWNEMHAGNHRQRFREGYSNGELAGITHHFIMLGESERKGTGIKVGLDCKCMLWKAGERARWEDTWKHGVLYGYLIMNWKGGGGGFGGGTEWGVFTRRILSSSDSE